MKPTDMLSTQGSRALNHVWELSLVLMLALATPFCMELWSGLSLAPVDIEALSLAVICTFAAVLVAWNVLCIVCAYVATLSVLPRRVQNALVRGVQRWGTPHARGILRQRLVRSAVSVSLISGAFIPSAVAAHLPSPIHPDLEVSTSSTATQQDPALSVLSSSPSEPTPPTPLSPSSSSPTTPSSVPLPRPQITREHIPSLRLPSPLLDTSSLTTRYVVRPGDCLWTIAESFHPEADDATISRLTNELYAANASVIGDNPDLIFPGTTLTVPPSFKELP